MKKWLFSAALLICITLCGCGSGIFTKEVQPEELQLTFRCPAEIQIGEQTYGCEIFHSIAQQTEITMMGPGVLAGLQYRQSGSDGVLSYEGMEYPAQKAGFPAESCLPRISDMLNCAQSYVNLEPMGENTFRGAVNGESFLITVDDDGNVVQLEAENLAVIFTMQTEK